MRIVVALGGNALLVRGEQPDAGIQQEHVVAAVDSLAPLARRHQLVVTHGNGPQVGILANESAADPTLSTPYPLDVLGAETQGMIGYWLLQAWENALPGREVASVLCQTVVDPDDPAFGAPTKFVGPVYTEDDAKQQAAAHGWEVRQDGPWWRRVVASPEPLELVERQVIADLLAREVLVVCSGGGGIPVVRVGRRYHGVEAVIDKDLTASLLARSVGADALLLLTDVPAVELHYGTPRAEAIRRTTPAELRAVRFPAGSMGPKVDAVCRFVEATGGLGAIGNLTDAEAILEGRAGTTVVAGPAPAPRQPAGRR